MISDGGMRMERDKRRRGGGRLKIGGGRETGDGLK